MGEHRAGIGVIGGSGLYSLLESPEEVKVDTPWGETSDVIGLAAVEGRAVAFIPRHGRGHTIPPHRINYRANLWALHSLGVERVIAPCAVGSLRADRPPGSLVVCDQFIDRTAGRRATYFEGPQVAHLSAADPYCDQLRPLAVDAATAAGLQAHDRGTVVVVEGPRFSTRAESRMYAALGCDVINMTQYPEVALARELGMCYTGMALVTDYDTGLEGLPEVKPVTQEQILETFRAATGALRAALTRLITLVPAERSCACAPAPAPINH